jgi:hypothetical protein
MNKKLGLVFGGVILYLLTAGGSFAYFSRSSSGQARNFKSPVASEASPKPSAFKRDPSLPRNEACPLNGEMYTKPERDLWETRRPLGVMIENSKPSRPQSGISFADVVYEANAEGGIPRFLAVYYCQSTDYVGPVRSARTYFLDWISEYGSSPLYAHVGGANTPGPANALGQIESYGWRVYNDLDNFSLGLPAYVVDTDRIGPGTAVEHSKYGVPEELWKAAAKRGLTQTEKDSRTGKEIRWDANFVPWKFKEDAPLADRPAGFTADFSLSGLQTSYAGDYTVRWQYDRAANAYLRFNGGQPFLDLNTNQQVLAKNVILQFMTMGPVDDGYNEEGHGTHIIYGTKGEGKIKLLRDGKVVDGTWSKKTRLDRTKFFDITGKEIALNRGQIWIEILPIGQPVTVN